MYDRTQTLSAEEEKYKTTRRESAAIALRLKPQNEFEIPEYYPAFLDMLKSLLDGNMDATTYEDKLRDMYGIHAYIAFTLDRVSLKSLKFSAFQLMFSFRSCQTRCDSCNSVSLNAMLSSVSSFTSWRAEIMRLAELVTRRTNEPLQSWLRPICAGRQRAYQRRAEASLQEEMYFKVFIVSLKL